MKKYQILVCFFLAFLFLCGCKETATPASGNKSSAVSGTTSAEPSKEGTGEASSHEKGKETSLVNSATESKVDAAPKEEVSSQEETNQQLFSYTDLNHVENHGKYYWVMDTEEAESPFVAVCNTQEELERILTQNYGFSQEKAQGCFAAYPKSYFESKSLLLLRLNKGDTSVKLFVNGVAVSGEELELSLHIDKPHSGGTAVETVVYHVEVDGKLNGLSTAVCSVYETELDKEPITYEKTVSLP